MSDFRAKMHQILFTLGSASDSAGENLQRSPDLLAVCKGGAYTSKGRVGKVEEEKRRERGKERREGREERVGKRG